MTAVGFEPTQLSLVELESTPLDHLGKLSCTSALPFLQSEVLQKPFLGKLAEARARECNRRQNELRVVAFDIFMPPKKKTVCPSGLRGWTQVPLAQAAWVQIPQLSFISRSIRAHMRRCAPKLRTRHTGPLASWESGYKLTETTSGSCCTYVVS